MKEQKKILIAEDNRMISQALRLLFEARGYEVALANDGQEAITQFENNRDGLTCAILDYNMPYFSGAEVASKIRASLPGLPIVLASASASELRGRPKIRTLFNAIFDKPFMMKDLLSCLDTLERASVPPPVTEVA